MTTLVLFAAMLCGQVQTAIPSECRSTTVSKNWYRIAIPGPSGDYHVWGTPEPSGGIRYLDAEQGPARARLGQERAEPAAREPINYGVEFTATHATAKVGRGNIQTNDPTYMEQADALIGEACGPSSPSCPTTEAGTDNMTIAVAVIATIAIAACVVTASYFAFPRRP